MLDKIWLILPPYEAEKDWAPRAVFETWQQAIAALNEQEGIKYEVQAATDEAVWAKASVGDDQYIYEARIVAVPIEYKTG